VNGAGYAATLLIPGGSLAFALWTSLRRQAQTQPRHRKPAYTERSGR
jgi:hypothetical protein